MEQTTQQHVSRNLWQSWLVPLCLLLFSVTIALLGDDAAQVLRYQRDAIFTGQWWRLFSAHLVHLGWSHLWINLAGLLMVWLLVGHAQSLFHWGMFILFTVIGISLGLLWWVPMVAWYVGLSGLLHGMLMAGSLRLTINGEREAIPLIVLLLGKVAWELWQGPLPGSREVAGGEVVYQAHALGCLCGATYVALRVMTAKLCSASA